MHIVWKCVKVSEYLCISSHSVPAIVGTPVVRFREVSAYDRPVCWWTLWEKIRGMICERGEKREEKKGEKRGRRGGKRGEGRRGEEN
jgi:hypothetical protein